MRKLAPYLAVLFVAALFWPVTLAIVLTLLSAIAAIAVIMAFPLTVVALAFGVPLLIERLRRQ